MVLGKVTASGDEIAFGVRELIDVVGDHLPAVLVHGPAAPALVVLAGPRIWSVGRCQHRAERDTVETHLLYAADFIGASTPARSSRVGNTSIAWRTGDGSSRPHQPSGP